MKRNIKKGFTLMILLALCSLVVLLDDGNLALADWAKSVSGRGRTQMDAVPQVLNYQGELRDPEGNPLQGAHDLTFRLYDDVTAPTALWSEEHLGVSVRDGHFSVLLGDNTPLQDTWFQDYADLYIGVTVAPYDEMVPRQRFASVPYALQSNNAANAEDAEQLGGFPAHQYSRTSHEHASLSASDGSPANVVQVNSDGEVGINAGATTEAQLRIYGDSNKDVHPGDDDAVLRVERSGSSASLLMDENEIDSYGSNLFINHNSYKDIILVDRGGRVGIGDSTPSYHLDVNGDVRVTGDLHVQGDRGLDVENNHAVSACNYGDDIRNLGSTTDRFCALSYTNTPNGYCQIYQSGGYFYLTARTYSSSCTICWAMCLDW